MTSIPPSIRYLLAPAALGLAGLGAACSSPTERTPDVPAVSVERASYTLPADRGAEVRFSFRNEGAEAASVPSCGVEVSPVIERRDAGEWRPYSSGVCLSSFMAGPIRVEPGTAHDGRAWIGEPGVYRVRVEYGTGVLRILYSATSPAFVVTR